MAKHILRRVVVEGTGEFPIDMLRYDQCYPATELDSGRILSLNGSRRSVELLCCSPVKMPWTPDRWASFGWKLVPGAF